MDVEKPLSILHVTPYYAPALAYGGSPAAATSLAAGQAALGQRVRVLTTDALDARRRVGRADDVLDGVAVRYLPNRSNSLAWDAKLFLPRGFAAELDRLLPETDIVHLHEFRSFTSYWAAARAERVGKPCVLTPHGSLAGGGLARRTLDALWGRRLIERCRGFAAVSQLEIEQLRGRGAPEQSISELPNAVRFPDQQPANAGELRASLGLLPAELLLLFAGRIARVKGLDILLRALQLLARDGLDNWRLALMGPDQGQRSSLEELALELRISGRVRWLGYLSDQAKWSALAAADLFVLPSRYEVFGISAVEALGMGTPALLSEQVGLAGALEAGCAVRAPAEPRGLARALSELFSDRERLARMGALGREWARRNFERLSVARRSLAIYRSILG